MVNMSHLKYSFFSVSTTATTWETVILYRLDYKLSRKQLIWSVILRLAQTPRTMSDCWLYRIGKYHLCVECKLSFNLSWFSSVEVLATLTSDVGRIISKLHAVQPNGNINLLTGIRIAHVSQIFILFWMEKKLMCRFFPACIEAPSR